MAQLLAPRTLGPVSSLSATPPPSSAPAPSSRSGRGAGEIIGSVADAAARILGGPRNTPGGAVAPVQTEDRGPDFVTIALVLLVVAILGGAAYFVSKSK